MGQNVGTHYIGFEDLRFNNFSMTYPEVPFLFQSPSNETNRCYIDPTTNIPTAPSYCEPGKFCECQHVIQEKWLKNGSFEVVLINPSYTAHPIHQHGGWYRVV